MSYPFSPAIDRSQPPNRTRPPERRSLSAPTCCRPSARGHTPRYPYPVVIRGRGHRWWRCGRRGRRRRRQRRVAAQMLLPPVLRAASTSAGAGGVGPHPAKTAAIGGGRCCPLSRRLPVHVVVGVGLVLQFVQEHVTLLLLPQTKAETKEFVSAATNLSDNLDEKLGPSFFSHPLLRLLQADGAVEKSKRTVLDPMSSHEHAAGR